MTMEASQSMTTSFEAHYGRRGSNAQTLSHLDNNVMEQTN